MASAVGRNFGSSATSAQQSTPSNRHFLALSAQLAPWPAPLRRRIASIVGIASASAYARASASGICTVGEHRGSQITQADWENYGDGGSRLSFGWRKFPQSSHALLPILLTACQHNGTAGQAAVLYTNPAIVPANYFIVEEYHKLLRSTSARF